MLSPDQLKLPVKKWRTQHPADRLQTQGISHRGADVPVRGTRHDGLRGLPAFLALLRDTWSISNSEAGFIGGAFFAGYMAAVPFLSALTDRIDARRIYIGSCLLAAVSNLAFAFLAQGVFTAALFQALAGAGLGGTYMPGLKALTDRVVGPRQSRYVSFYTATFGVGTSLSLLLAGWLGRMVPWHSAFGWLAAGLSSLPSLSFSACTP